MKILITGSEGFIGHHLASHLEGKGHAVHRGVLRGPKGIACDVRSFKSVESVIRKTKPDCIFHLAAQSYLGPSWADPWGTFDANVNGTINMLEALKRLKLGSRLVIAGSSAQYGVASRAMKEGDPLHPVSPYGVSKATQELLGYQYHANFGLDAVTARLFLVKGPRKTRDSFYDFAIQIVKIERGEQRPVMEVGNLDVYRDITDVRDAVVALEKMMLKAEPGNSYNVCSGTAYYMRDIAEKFLSNCRVPAKLRQAKARFRSADEKVIRGDGRKLFLATGWKAKIPIEKTIADTIEFWRENL
jgi:GDP-4-dehydro-6-deoxy-D-mannose reductase